VGEFEFESRPAVADHHIHAVEGRGADANEDFARFGLGRGKVSVFENFGSAMLAEEGGFHFNLIIGVDLLADLRVCPGRTRRVRPYRFLAITVIEPLSL
jgi:hypothetical protein